MGRVRAFILIVAGVFVSAAGPIFILNATNIWTIPISTWQTIVSAGVAGVVTYLIAVVAPVDVRVSPKLTLPEA